MQEFPVTVKSVQWPWGNVCAQLAWSRIPAGQKAMLWEFLGTAYSVKGPEVNIQRA